jgi:hypothetical protein
MARAPRLKVYRTAAGFHDAYVAASSQKAALAAWGSEHDLFARGVAELVTDPELAAEPLASPGVVIKRSRGTAAEQIAALPDRKPTPQARKAPAPAPRQAKARPPKPGSAKVDSAAAALDAVQREHDRQLHALAEREAALARERRSLERARDAALGKAQKVLDAEQAAYDAALRAWRAAR